MSIKLVNDWQYIFKPSSDRFISFTFIQVNYFNVGDIAPDIDINGFTIIILGLGIRVK